MSRIIQADEPSAPAGRRNFLGQLGTATLSAGAVALIAGCESMAGGTGASYSAAANPKKDVGLLNYALGLEHEAIDIYQIAAETGLLTKPVLGVAVQFQGHHKAHRDALAATVRQLGGAPVAAKSRAYYLGRIKQYKLRNQRDILELAYKLEGIAANEYIKAIPAFTNSALAKVAGRLVADETMHWTTYAQALGKPLPQAGLSFGA